MSEAGEIASIRRSNYGKWVVVSALCGFIFLFFSCEHEEDCANNRNVVLVPATGEPVTINFTVGERNFGNNDVTVRNAQVFSISPLSEGLEEVSLFLSTSLQEKIPSVSLRNSGPLAAGRKARVVAYEINTLTIPFDTIQLTYTDYEVNAGGNLVPYGTLPMTVPSGTILFVAYSFNDTITMDAFAETIAAIGSRDLLWGDTTVTVGLGNTNVHILLDHLFSKIEVEAEALIPSTNIHAIYGARYDHTLPCIDCPVRRFDAKPPP